MENMKVLVIGLGSMGKRRIRNLMALGVKEIAGVDNREDRKEEAVKKYGITTFNSITEALQDNKFDAWVISVPPDVHHSYMELSIKNNTPAFIEASVVDHGFEDLIAQSKGKKVLLAPSCTLYFHPAIKKIEALVKSNTLGTISNILYHSGQYLPDWHTYEPVNDYYVSKKETGGAREIVPFELSWLTKVFGFPAKVCGMYRKTIRIEGAEKIDDTYNCLMDFGTFMIGLTVDVVSRAATRTFMINGSEKQLTWNWNDGFIKIFDPAKNEWEKIEYETLEAEPGYNKNITEQMYIDEMKSYLNAAAGKGTFENNMEDDHKVLKVLYAVERSFDENKFISLA